MLSIRTIYLSLFICQSSFAAELASVTVSSGNEISYSHYAAKGDDLLLWFYSEAGPKASDYALAAAMANSGTEVWMIELFASYFLPAGMSSMDNISTSDISDLIRISHQKTAKNIIAISSGRAVVPLLRATRELQTLKNTDNVLSGLILISPKFYTKTPEPGQQGTLMPIVQNTDALIFLIQPKQSPWFWKLDQTIPALQRNGSDVFLKVINKVRDRFYFRPDANAYENTVHDQLPVILNQAIRALKRFPEKTRVASEQTVQAPASGNNIKQKKLRPQNTNTTPAALKLNSITDQSIDLKQYKDTVVLVNFWASWCPPCVHEMPSMQRLQDLFQKDKFVILGVNMAEEKSVIQHFLKTRVSVNFPILMDTDGAALKSWQVFAFPTSYLIDKKGQIRYSLFGSIEWDNAETISVINQLINE